MGVLGTITCVTGLLLLYVGGMGLDGPGNAGEWIAGVGFCMFVIPAIIGICKESRSEQG